MEIKAKLQKPYEEKQRLEFIVEQNHKKGYEIRETTEGLEAYGYTDKEKQEKILIEQKNKIKLCLEELDKKTIRSLRAIQADAATDADREFLESIETQAQNLRAQLKELGE